MAQYLLDTTTIIDHLRGVELNFFYAYIFIKSRLKLYKNRFWKYFNAPPETLPNLARLKINIDNSYFP
jgi:hypothetical protein